MKIALVLSGLPRKVKAAYINYWGKFIDKYQPDLYLQCWKYDEWELVSEYYKNPKKIIIEEPFSFKQYCDNIQSDKGVNLPIPPFDVDKLFRGIPMFWAWQKISNEIIGEYDLIVRSRYDLIGIDLINLEELDSSKLNISTSWGACEVPDDNFLVTNQTNYSNFFNTCFDNLIVHLKYTKRLKAPEKMLLELLKKQKMNTLIHKTKKLDFRLLR